MKGVKSVCLLIIFLTWNFTQAELINYHFARENSSGLRNMSPCCDFNQLNTQLSCPSSPEGNDLESLRKLYGHKLKCEIESIQNVQVNTTFYPQFNQYFFVEQGSRRIFMNEISYPGDSYCVHNIEHVDTISILICSPGCSADSPCVRRCCGWGRSFVEVRKGDWPCVSIDPKYSNFSQMFETKISKGNFDSFKFITGHQVQTHGGSCGASPDLVLSDEEFRILEDGKLENSFRYETVYYHEDYCIEERFDSGVKSSKLFGYVCQNDIVAHVRSFHLIRMGYSILSGLFLGVSLVVFLIIWRDHSINGWTQFAFLFAAFLPYVARAILLTLSLMRYERTENERPDQRITFLVGILFKFFECGLLLNVLNMNAHLFWTFLKLKPQPKLTTWDDLRVLVLPVVACWITAGVIISVKLIVLFLPDYTSGWNEVVGVSYTIFTYVVWAVVLFLSSGIAFILIKRLRERSSISSTGNSGTSQTVGVLVRLFFITGLVWILDYTDILLTKDVYRRGWAWEAVEFLTYNNGVILFFVIVWNKKTLKSLRKRFPRCQPTREAGKSHSKKTASTQRTTVT